VSVSFVTATVTELVDSFFRVMVKPVITSDTTFELLVMSMPLYEEAMKAFRGT